MTSPLSVVSVGNVVYLASAVLAVLAVTSVGFVPFTKLKPQTHEAGSPIVNFCVWMSPK